MLRTMEIHDVPETALHDTLRDLVDTLARFETRIKEDLDGGTT